MALKNPFALRKADNRIVMIGDLSPEQSKKDCGCICPVCGADFVARMGDKNVPHFAHKAGSMCDAEKAYKNSLYQLMLEGLTAESTCFHLPECYGLFQGNHEDFSKTPRLGYKRIIKEYGFAVESVHIRKNRQGIAEALILTDRKENSLAVVLAPPPTLCKTSCPKQVEGVATIAIWIPKTLDFYHVKSDYLKHVLLEETQHREWLGHRKIDEWRQKCQEEEAERVRRKMDEQARIAERKEAADRQMADILVEYRASQPAAWDYNNDEELSAIRCHFSKKYAASEIPRDCIKDPQAERWCFCDSCKQWYLEVDMGVRATDDFDKNPNLGLCSKCVRKMQ